MAKKITLTVPDALYQQIDRWRSGFNMSRIFQDAVSDAIRKKEEFQKRMGEETVLNDVISRLKAEKTNWENKMEIQAEKAGSLWATKAHYEDLLLAATASADQVLSLPQIQAQIAETFSQLSELPSNLGEGLDQMKAKVQEGWLRGVREFWESVKDKL